MNSSKGSGTNGISGSISGGTNVTRKTIEIPKDWKEAVNTYESK